MFFFERDCLSKICVIDVLRFMILSFKLVQEPDEPNDDEEPAPLAEQSSVPWTIPDAGFKQEQLFLPYIIYSTYSLYIFRLHVHHVNPRFGAVLGPFCSPPLWLEEFTLVIRRALLREWAHFREHHYKDTLQFRRWIK